MGIIVFLKKIIFKILCNDLSLNIFLRTRHKKELYEGVGINSDKLLFRILKCLGERKTFIIPECDIRLENIIRDCWIFEPEERPSFITLMQKLSDLEPNLPEFDELQYDETVDEEEEVEDDEEYDNEYEQVPVQTSDQDSQISSEHVFMSSQETERSEFNPEDVSIPKFF